MFVDTKRSVESPETRGKPEDASNGGRWLDDVETGFLRDVGDSEASFYSSGRGRRVILQKTREDTTDGKRQHIFLALAITCVCR